MFIFFSIIALIAYTLIFLGVFTKKSKFVKIIIYCLLFAVVLPFWAGITLLTVNYLLPGFQPLLPANSIYNILLVENNGAKPCKFAVFTKSDGKFELIIKSAQLQYKLRFLNPVEQVAPGKTDTLIYVIDTLKYKSIEVANLNKSGNNSFKTIGLKTSSVPYKIFNDDFDSYKSKVLTIDLGKEYRLIYLYFLAIGFFIVHILKFKMKLYLRIPFILINVILTLFASLMLYNLALVIIDFWIKL